METVSDEPREYVFNKYEAISRHVLSRSFDNKELQDAYINKMKTKIHEYISEGKFETEWMKTNSSGEIFSLKSF